MRNTVGDDATRSAGESLPGWASRHLAEADLGAADHPSAGPVTGRHRHGGRRRRPESSRLRGWALATAAVAAATGSVPLALSTLAREEAPMPRVGTFPVSVPVDLPTAGGAGARGGGTLAPGSTPGPDVAAVLPPLAPLDVAVDASDVVPTADGRALPPPGRDAVAPATDHVRHAPPARSAPPRRTTTTTTPSRPPAGSDDGDTTTTRGSTAGTTTTTPAPRSGRHAERSDDYSDDDSGERGGDRGDHRDDRGGEHRDPSLVGSTLDAVRGVGGGLLG